MVDTGTGAGGGAGIILFPSGPGAKLVFDEILLPVKTGKSMSTRLSSSSCCFNFDLDALPETSRPFLCFKTSHLPFSRCFLKEFLKTNFFEQC